MATQKQIEANRRNAQRSTGPKTPEGKARSALNALQHGIRSSLAVIPGESREEFETLYDAIRDDFQPTDSMEEILVRQIASAEWRLQRMQRAEAALRNSIYKAMQTLKVRSPNRANEPNSPSAPATSAETSGTARSPAQPHDAPRVCRAPVS